MKTQSTKGRRSDETVLQEPVRRCTQVKCHQELVLSSLGLAICWHCEWVLESESEILVQKRGKGRAACLGLCSFSLGMDG